MKFHTAAAYLGIILSAIAVCAVVPRPADGELRWQEPKKEAMRVRLVAMAEEYPRSSFFSSHEVFIAEKQLSENESRLVKLVYQFLPYQPRLSDSGLDFSTIHELLAVRDPSCDETFSHLISPNELRGASRPQSVTTVIYSADSPVIDSTRRKSPLPCYETTPEDYTRAVHRPPARNERF